MVTSLSRNWWLVVLRGIKVLIMGLICLKKVADVQTGSLN